MADENKTTPPVAPPVTPPVTPPVAPPPPSKPAGPKKYVVSLDGYPTFPLGIEATATFTTDDPGKLRDMFLEKFGLTELPQPLVFKEV